MITFREVLSVIWMNGAPVVTSVLGGLTGGWHLAWIGLIASLLVSCCIGLPCMWLYKREQSARAKREQEREWGPVGDRLGHPRG